MTRPSKYYEIEDQIAAVIADLELYSYYQILDVRPDTSADVILYTYNVKCYEYEQLQKDRFCGAVLHHNLTLLRERLDEAKQVLVDPTLRRAYDQGLELGEMRHAATAAQSPAAQRGEGPKDALIEHLAGKLERTIHKEYLNAGEELLPDEPSMGIDLEAVDQEKILLEEQVAKLGVELQVTASEDPLAAPPIDGKFLDEATRQLTGKLYVEHSLSLHDRGEAEDVAADARFAGDLTEGLRGELYKMGVSEWEAPKEIERPIDAGFIDDLLAQERRALVDLGVSAEVKADEELRPIDGIAADELAAGLESELQQMKIRYDAERPAQRRGLASLVDEARSAEPASAAPVVLIPLPQASAEPVPFEDAIAIDDVLDAVPAPLGAQAEQQRRVTPLPATGPLPQVARLATPHHPTGPLPQVARPATPHHPTGPLPQVVPRPATPHHPTGPLPQVVPRQPTGPLPQVAARPVRHTTGPQPQSRLPPLGIAPLESAAPATGTRRGTGPLPAPAAPPALPTMDEADDLVILLGEDDPPK